MLLPMKQTSTTNTYLVCSGPDSGKIVSVMFRSEKWLSDRCLDPALKALCGIVHSDGKPVDPSTVSAVEADIRSYQRDVCWDFDTGTQLPDGSFTRELVFGRWFHQVPQTEDVYLKSIRIR